MDAVTKRSWRVIGEAAAKNLPRNLTTFVGRGTELSALKSLLARSRIATITG